MKFGYRIKLLAWFLSVFASVLMCSPFLFASTHPLDDLSPEEITKVNEVITKSLRFSEAKRYPILRVKEPPKSEMQKFFSTGRIPARQAFALVFEKKENKLSEVIVDLDLNTLSSVTLKKGYQAPILFEEYDLINEIVKSDPRWKLALEKRGLSMNDVWLDGWAPGLESKEQKESGKRLIRGVPYYKEKIKNFYSRPIENLSVVFDMNSETIFEISDDEVIPVGRGKELLPKTHSALGHPLTRLVTQQPEGPSFKIIGQQIEWNNWVFRYSMQPMEGLVIYLLNYKDDKKVRSVMYKGSLAEMLVPYGDGSKNWSYRNAFDVGEYGIGRTAHVLEPSVDVPDQAVFLDANFAGDRGEVMKVPRAVAIYERDGGVLWKHYNQFTKEVAAMRARQLVMTFTTTVGNYDYGVNWILNQDGTIEVEVHLTGILLAKGSVLTKNPCRSRCERLAEPFIITPNHQHFFAFRLDMDIDGPNNTAIELNTKPGPLGPKNPDGNAFEMAQTVFKSESYAFGDLNLAQARSWKVINTTVTNDVEHPAGYTLMPGENSISYLHPTSPIRGRAEFVDHPVWFTKYHDEEQHPAGDYPYQSRVNEGIKAMQANNEKLENEDIVMWYVFGVTHHPRPEEWPVMPTHRAGFKLMPMNFFSKNPMTQ